MGEHADGERTKASLTRSMSSIRVPRPGPTSMSWTPRGTRAWLIHSATNHRPTSSPKTCEISGDVTKSPFAPNWSRPRPLPPSVPSRAPL